MDHRAPQPRRSGPKIGFPSGPVNDLLNLRTVVYAIAIFINLRPL